jgi:hypothetical protein
MSVLCSMSVKRKVTVPVGRLGIHAASMLHSFWAAYTRAVFGNAPSGSSGMTCPEQPLGNGNIL